MLIFQSFREQRAEYELWTCDDPDQRSGSTAASDFWSFFQYDAMTQSDRFLKHAKSACSGFKKDSRYSFNIWVCLKIVYPQTQWLSWSLSLWKMAISLGIYPIFRQTHILKWSVPCTSRLHGSMSGRVVRSWSAARCAFFHRHSRNPGLFDAIRGIEVTKKFPKLQLHWSSV